MSNFIVGLTGGIGSGKTTVANMFADLGITLVDADVVARDVVEPNSYALNEIIKHFGDNFVLPTGFLDRAKLRQKIFSSEADKQWLNNLLHPLIRQSMVAQLTNNTDDYCILVAPLLLENNLVSYVNRVLVIDVDESIQIERTLKRDNTDSGTVKSIINSQISRKERLAASDDIIDNSTASLNDIQQQVAALHKSYLALSSSHT